MLRYRAFLFWNIVPFYCFERREHILILMQHAMHLQLRQAVHACAVGPRNREGCSLPTIRTSMIMEGTQHYVWKFYLRDRMCVVLGRASRLLQYQSVAIVRRRLSRSDILATLYIKCQQFVESTDKARTLRELQHSIIFKYRLPLLHESLHPFCSVLEGKGAIIQAALNLQPGIQTHLIGYGLSVPCQM